MADANAAYVFSRPPEPDESLSTTPLVLGGEPQPTPNLAVRQQAPTMAQQLEHATELATNYRWCLAEMEWRLEETIRATNRAGRTPAGSWSFDPSRPADLVVIAHALREMTVRGKENGWNVTNIDGFAWSYSAVLGLAQEGQAELDRLKALTGMVEDAMAEAYVGEDHGYDGDYDSDVLLGALLKRFDMTPKKEES